MDNKAKFVVGFAVGMIVGGVVALLVTPKSGKENRETIKAKAKQFGNKFKKKSQDN
jgi:gas vesicle protein